MTWFAALVLLLGALQPARGIVQVSQSPHLVQQVQPDGGLLLRLGDRVPDVMMEFPLVIRHQGARLTVRQANGQPIDLPLRELERGRGQTSVGLLAPRNLLAVGLEFREEGLPERATPLRATGSADAWARHAFLRIETSREGLVRITGEWLAQQVDEPLPDPRTWTLVHNGAVELLLAEGCEDGSFDPEDAVVFWAAPTTPQVPELGPDTWRDPWCSREIYFLASNGQPGPRFAQESGEIVETNPDLYHTPITFPSEVHVEEDEHFSRLTYVLDEPHPDHQFWTTGIFGGELRTVAFNTPGLYSFSNRPVRMRVCLRGLGAPTEDDDPDVFQRLRLFVNSQGGGALEVGAAGDWKNQELRIAEFGVEAFPEHGSFQDGANTLFLAGVDESPASEFSSCMLNWLEVEYDRLYRAEAGLLAFTADAEFDGDVVNFEINGFNEAEILVLKLGQSQLRSGIVRAQGGAWRLRFQDVFTSGTRYVAATRSAMRPPDAVERVSRHNLAEAGGGAAAIIVMADSLFRSNGAELLEPLLEQVRADLGPVLVVSDRWVYDEFSHGRNHPHGIREFINQAWANWSVPPRWLLLVGDGTLAPRATRPGREPVLPLIYEQVYKWGAASSDDWYARSPGGAQLPVLVSRWPAATPEELINLVQKEAAYRQSTPGPWRNSMLFTSGARARDEGIFMRQTEDLIRYSLLSKRHFIRRINAGEEGGLYIGSRAELVELLNQGQLLVNYSGHGGGAVWEDNSLFRSEDVTLLDNGERLPFVTNATCFIASLDFQGALGRTLLNAGSMGAIGVLGSTGLGFRDMGMELVAEFYEILGANPDYSVAEVLREAKQRLWLRHAAGDENSLPALRAHAVIVMNTILGLPWQQLLLPGEMQPRLANPVVDPGETLLLAGDGGLPGATGLVEVYSASERPHQAGSDFIHDVTQASFTVGSSGEWAVSLPAPAALSGGGAVATLRAYFPMTGGEDASGSSWFYYADSLDRTLVWNTRLEPEAPLPDQPFNIQVLIAGPQEPDSVVANLRAWRPAGDSLDIRIRMSPVAGDPQRFRTSTAVAGQPDGTVLRLHFELYHEGMVESTVPSTYQIAAPAPRIIWENTGELDAAGRSVVLLRNTGAAEGDSLHVVLLRQNGDFAGTFWLDPLSAGAERREPLLLLVGRLGERLRLHADWNPDHGGPLPADLELTLDPLTLTGTSWREVAPGLQLRCVGDGGRAVSINTLSNMELTDRQQTLTLSGQSYRLKWLDGAAPGRIEGRLAIGGLDSLHTTKTGLMVYHAASRILLSTVLGEVQTQRGDSVVFHFSLDAGDGFAPGWLTDAVPPHVELEVAGQVFADGGYVPPDAAFTWLLADPSGIDPRPEFLSVVLDGDSIGIEELALFTNPDTGEMGLRLQLDDVAPRASSQIVLVCRDAAGNVARLETGFRVGEGLSLLYCGNYPNPFQSETRFVFSLSGVAEKATIDIYTVAGRRIRRLEVPGPVINYVETLWDGRDRNGDVVANGVYFYRFHAGGDDGAVEYLGKVARLK